MILILLSFNLRPVLHIKSTGKIDLDFLSRIAIESHDTWKNNLVFLEN